jgi:hypothetical protein
VSGDVSLLVTFKVERVWKGVTTSEIVVVTSWWRDSSFGGCGIQFSEGRSYLIAAEPAQRPFTAICSDGWRRTRNEADFIAALGEGAPPNP